MSALREAIEHATLGWVKPELDSALQQVQGEIEAYVDAPGDVGPLRTATSQLRQIEGTLRMLELYAPATLIEEMHALTSALSEGEIADRRDEACAALGRASIQLPDYLERLQSGHRDIPVVLLPLLNEMRGFRGEAALGESVLFSPDFERPLPKEVVDVPEQAPTGGRELLDQYEGDFRRLLNEWQSNGDVSATSLKERIDGLFGFARDEDMRRLLWVASETAQAMGEGALMATRQLREAFAAVVEEVQASRQETGLASGNASSSYLPVRKLLQQVARVDTRNPSLDRLRETFGLQGTAVSAEELAHAQSSVTGVNRALLDTVTGALKEDVFRVKDSLDLHLRTGNTNAAELRNEVDALSRISDTLGMLGLGGARDLVQRQRDLLASVVNGEKAADESVLLDVAGALLFVDASLEDQVSQLGREVGRQSGEESSRTSDAEQLLTALTREAVVNFGDARQAFVAFVETGWDHAALAEVPRLLNEVSGALGMLELPQSAEYVTGIRLFTENELIQKRRVPGSQQLDTFADAIASVEYYLEALRDKRADREDILAITQQSLEALRYWPLPSTMTEAPMPSLGNEIEDAYEAFLETATAEQQAMEASEVLATAQAELEATDASQIRPWARTDATDELKANLKLRPELQFDMSKDDIDDEIREIFVEEFKDEIENLGVLLPPWRQAPGEAERLRPIRRVFHTLKGSGRLVGATKLGEFSWKIENMLNRVLDGSRPASPEVVALVDAAMEELPSLYGALRNEAVPEVDLAGIESVAEQLAEGAEVTYSRPAPTEAEEVAQVTHMPVHIDPVLLEILSAEVQGHMVHFDQWLARQPAVPDEAVVRAVHTMNGAFSMAEVPGVSDAASPAEAYLKRLKSAGQVPSETGVQALRSLASHVRDSVVALQATPQTVPLDSVLEATFITLRDALPAPSPEDLGFVDELDDALDAQQQEEALALEAARLEQERLEAEAQAAAERSAILEAEAALLEANRLEAERIEAERVEAERVEAERIAAEQAEAERAEAERMEAERIEAERIEAERIEAERIEAERVEAERVEAERVEAERVEAERVEAERVEAERVEAERVEAERVEAERVEAERVEAERVEAERAEAERIEAERLEAERMAPTQQTPEDVSAAALATAALVATQESEAQHLELERIAAEQAEADRRAVEPGGVERIAAEHAEAERLAAEQAETERVAAEQAKAERAAAEEAERVAAEHIEAERIAAEHAEAERIEAERVEAERVEAERIEAERIEAERIEAERIAAERIEAERIEAERIEAERIAAEQAEAERIAAEQAEAERIAAEHAEAERIAAEHAEAERIAAEKAEAERLAAEHAEAERIAAERAEAERLEEERVAAENALAEQFAAEQAEIARLGSLTTGAPMEGISAPEARSSSAKTAQSAYSNLTADIGPAHPLDAANLDLELLDIFTEECNDILDNSDGLLVQLREPGDNTETIKALQRDLHTLKGGARMAGIMSIGDLGHSMESLLEAVAERRTEFGSDAIPLLERGLDTLRAMSERVMARESSSAPNDLIAAFNARARGVAFDHSALTAVEHAPIQLAELSAPAETALDKEAQGASVARGAQEQVRIRADLLDRLVNYAGEVAIYRSRLEQQLGAFRSSMGEMEQTNLRLRDQLRRLDLETEAQIVARYQREHDARDPTFDPLELDRFSTLQQLTRALSESASDMSTLQVTLEDLTRQYETLLLQQSRVSTDLQEGLMRTRMIPFDSVLPRLRRVIRQAAGDSDKEARLTVQGAQSDIDRNVLERMTAPLEHLLRNAVAHGIEAPTARRRAGKPAEGTINVQVKHEGSEIVMTIQDDGAGLNYEAIRSRGIERGLIAAEAQPTKTELASLILSPGFSTAKSVSQLAGRGVGMDVVDSEVRQLGGSMEISSEDKQGTRFVLRLPQTLAVTPAVFVRIGETSYAVPIASVQGVSRLGRDSYVPGESKLEYGGAEYTVHDLGLLLNQPRARADEQLQIPMLLLGAGDLRVAVGVDQILGNREIVVKPVGPQVSSIPGIFGATVMGDGSVVVILDVVPLARRFASAPRDLDETPAQAPETHVVPVVMVVDDSVTMRKVTGRVLERQGYEVLTAKDGIDALERMAEKVPDLMLLDIEMPRMDGYELATEMRRDPRLRDVPIIMITSRTGEKHRERAFDIGVNRYLGKPYQEPELLKNVNELLEQAREQR